MSIFRGIMYFIMDASMNMQILIFVCILFLIEERFRHLCSMIELSKGEGLFLIYLLNGYTVLRFTGLFIFDQFYASFNRIRAVVDRFLQSIYFSSFMLHSKEFCHSINSYFILFRSLCLIVIIENLFLTNSSDLSFKTAINHEKSRVPERNRKFLRYEFYTIRRLDRFPRWQYGIVEFLSRILIARWATRANEFEWMFNRTFVFLFSNNYFYRFFPRCYQLTR